MHNSEAYNALVKPMSDFLPYGEAIKLAETATVKTFKSRGPSGAEYTIQLSCFWHDPLAGIIRLEAILVSSTAGEITPMTQSVLISPPSAGE
jgi:hypothetical protein